MLNLFLRRGCCLVLLGIACDFFAAEPASAQRQASAVGPRAAWTTSRLAGSPDPPAPFRVQLAFPELKFREPLDITNAPGSNRLFVAEQRGRIYSFANNPQVDRADLVVDLRRIHARFSALYGLAFHPDFQRNRHVYVCYVVGDEGQSDGTRVSRFTILPDEPPRIDPDSEQLVITWLGGGHNGGCLKFGPDGYLYIATGDAASPSPPDPLNAGQDVSNLLSAILRIDVDHADEPRAYRIPPDNPFVDLAGARGEIWSYGYRNPWKMSFDRATGDLWVGDVGWELWEMIYRVQKGGNYGWSIMEGPQPVRPEDTPGPTPILPPTVAHPHSEAASITGGMVYRGQRLPQLQGVYVYGDYQSGIVWGLRMDGDQVVWHQELAQTPLQLVGFGEDHAGEMYLLDYQQQIFVLVENTEADTSQHFPRRLSETGLFTDTAKQMAAPGVLAYSINAEPWADDTRAERWLAVPGSEPIRIDREGRWQFPEGSVIAKTVQLETERNVPASNRRIETQILHRESDRWRPYTYIWNDEQTDAELASADGGWRTFSVVDSQAPGGLREYEHRFHGRRECVLCHNPWVETATASFGMQSASPLAVRSAQLDREQTYGDVQANQLQTLRELGLLQSEHSRPEETPLVNPYDEAADLDPRARAYLDVNCSHCHQFNAGGTATILLSASVPLDETRMIGMRPTQGTFGISDAKIIAPGDPFGSVLFYRIAKLGGGRMPRIGSREVDPQGVRLIHDWILQRTGTDSRASLSPLAEFERASDSSSSPNQAATIQQLTSSTRGALKLWWLLDQQMLDETTRQQAIALTRDHAASEVRDLFECFVPAAQRIRRLGSAFDMAEILELPADAERGMQVFRDNSVTCKNCHRIRDVGEALGPDLDQIGQKYDRRQMLQHILEPSRFIDPQYVPYIVETASGQVLTGLVEQQTDTELVLRDANRQVHRIPAAEIEVLVRQPKSLMPELLLRDMTAQQVADLLAYLGALR